MNSQALIKPSGQGGEVAVYSEEFLSKIDAIGDAIFKKREEISSIPTPQSKVQTFGDAKKKPRIRWEDLEFVSEDYMKFLLNKHFKSLWSWVGFGAGLQVHEVIGQVSFTGTLQILEGGILLRQFTACGGSAIKLKSGEAISIANIINFGNDCKAANTDAFKKAINMLTNICDDVYGKKPDIKTDKKLLKEMINLYNLMPDGKDKNEVNTYIYNEYGGWESIANEQALAIIENLKLKTGAMDVQNNLQKQYQNNPQQYQQQVIYNQ